MPSLSCRAHGDDRHVADREVHRVGDEALGVSFRVQARGGLGHLWRGNGHLRPQNNLGEPAAAVVSLGHAATGVIGVAGHDHPGRGDRKSTRLNSSHVRISYAVFCLKKKKKNNTTQEKYKKKTKKQKK